MKTLRLIELKWSCNYCKSMVVQRAKDNPPSHCPQCEGKQENEEVERLMWTMSNVLFIDKLRKHADPNFRGKTKKSIKKLRSLRKEG